jgi:cellulose biosynthesis protein BcsQ
MTAIQTAPALGDRHRPIYWIGGSKGGVGKSMMAIAALDYLLERGTSVGLVESDTSNPDVWKVYKDVVPVELINLDESDGWVDLVNVCDQHSDRVVVVNTAARNNLAVTQVERRTGGARRCAHR